MSERMTDAEVIRHIRENTPLNRLRAIFSGEAARIVRAHLQCQTPTPIETRRMEFEAVERIAAAIAAGVLDEH